LCQLFRVEGRYPDTGTLSLNRSGGSRRSGCDRRRRRWGHAIELGQRTSWERNLVVVEKAWSGSRHTSEGQFSSRIATGLVVADKTESYAEAGLGEKATVLVVGNLPDLAQRVRQV
jgi:hypothetical protein